MVDSTDSVLACSARGRSRHTDTELELNRLKWRLNALQKGLKTKTMLETLGPAVLLRFDDSDIRAYVREQEERFLADRKRKSITVVIEDENCSNL